MKTTAHEITTADGWLLVAQNPSDILIQLRSNDALEVYGGASEPAPDALGIILWDGGSKEFSAAGLPTGTSFWVRLREANETALAVVMENGDAL